MKGMILMASLLVWLLGSVAYGQTVMPGPEHKKLDVAVGSWTYEGVEQPSGLGPGGTWVGVEQFEWLPGGFFLRMNREAKGPGGDTRHSIIFGYDSVAKTHTGQWYDFTAGGAASATIEVLGNTWLWSATGHSGEGVAFEERCTVTWAAAGTSYALTCEIATDGKPWSPYYEGTYTKSP